MQVSPAKDSVVRDWLPVVAWTLFIYATIPLARTVAVWVTEHWTRAVFSWAAYAIVAIGLLLAIRQFRQRAVPVARGQWITLGLLAALFAWGAWYLRANAEEAMHLPQYGVLSLLLYRAFSRRYRDRAAYACAALLGSSLGIFDEVIQWAVPRRFFEFRDIIINVLSVLLIQAALAASLATRYRSVRAGFASARTAWGLAALVLLLLLSCFSNTPEVWQPLRSHWPKLQIFEEPMVQYGHRIHDPEVGWFKSRLTAEQLREADQQRAEEAGKILRRFGHEVWYGAFLAEYSPMQDPYLHELRVRLFRRDRYAYLARITRGAPEKRKELLSIAFTEQRLLENWYPHTLRTSGMDWPIALRARAAAAAASSGERPASAVSRGLLTRFTKPQAQAAFGALLLVLALAASYDLSRRRRDARHAS